MSAPRTYAPFLLAAFALGFQATVSFATASAVKSAGSLELAHGFRFLWLTDPAAGTMRGRLELDEPDCWASVGFAAPGEAGATMVGGDFIVGERDGKTQTPVVRSYAANPKGNTVPIRRADQSSTRLLAAKMAPGEGSTWVFERDLEPADGNQTALAPGAPVKLIWATCNWAAQGQKDAIYLCNDTKPDAQCSAHGYHGGNRSAAVTTVDFFETVTDFATGPLLLADGLTAGFSTNMSAGTVQGTMRLEEPDCWASVGFAAPGEAGASMVGGDFIVGERDGKTQTPVVRSYGANPKGNTVPIRRAESANVVAATEAEMAHAGGSGSSASFWSFDRQMAPASADAPWLVPGPAGRHGLIWATCNWAAQGQKDAIYLCNDTKPDAQCSAHGYHGGNRSAAVTTVDLFAGAPTCAASDTKPQTKPCHCSRSVSAQTADCEKGAFCWLDHTVHAAAKGSDVLVFDKLMSATFKVSEDKTEITFNVTLKRPNAYLSIGVSPAGTMNNGGSGSDIVICSDDNQGKAPLRYFVTKKSTPTGGRSLPTGGGTGTSAKSSPQSCTWAGGVSTMVFTRSVAAEDPATTLAVHTAPGKTTTLIWAYGQDRKLDYHIAQGSVTADLSGNGGGGGSTGASISALLWLHMALMLVAWGAVLPFGVLWIRYQKHNEARTAGGAPVWFAYHKWLQYAGWALQIAGYFCAWGYIQSQGMSHFGSTTGNKVQSAHMITGFAVFLAGTLQPLNAFFRPHARGPGEAAPEGRCGRCCGDGRARWELLHKGLGHAAILFGAGNVFLGAYLAFKLDFNSAALYWVPAIGGACTVIPMLIYATAREIQWCRAARDEGGYFDEPLMGKA